jgi:hypothetical protein
MPSCSAVPPRPFTPIGAISDPSPIGLRPVSVGPRSATRWGYPLNRAGSATVPVCQLTGSRSTLLVAMTAQATGNLAP